MTKRNTLSAPLALQKLKEGNQRYLQHAPISYPTADQRTDFEQGQKPYAVVLSCADSRVSPEIMFNAGLDELFIVRVAGNIAETASMASIEYAIRELNTKLIIVIGHERCAAVETALNSATAPLDLGVHLNTLLAHVTPAILAAQTKEMAFREAPLTTTVKEHARLTAQELRKRSAIISQAQDVEIVWAYYHMISGQVDFSSFL